MNFHVNFSDWIFSMTRNTLMTLALSPTAIKNFSGLFVLKIDFKFVFGWWNKRRPERESEMCTPDGVENIECQWRIHEEIVVHFSKLLGCRKSHYYVRVCKIWIFIILREMRGKTFLPCSHHLNSIWGREQQHISHLTQYFALYNISCSSMSKFLAFANGMNIQVPFKNHQY